MKQYEITTNALLETAKEISKNVYGQENELITRCFSCFPNNNDINIVAMKIGLIDITNSTNIAKYKSKMGVHDLARHIVEIPDLDLMIQSGDLNAVRLIANTHKGISLFSFATKYCCYHNHNVYKKDDYSIYDTVIAKSLPNYFEDISYSTLKKWRQECNYEEFSSYIEIKLNYLGIYLPNRRRLFDRYIWYKNK